MDIAELKPVEDIFEIRHPRTNELVGIRVGLRSIEDEALQKVKRRIRNEQIKLGSKNKSFDSEQEDENERLLVFTAMTFWEWYAPVIEPEKIVPAKTELRINPDTKKEETIEIEPAKTIAAVIGEKPTFHGEVPTFSQAMVYKVFKELPWFLDALSDKCAEKKSFFRV